MQEQIELEITTRDQRGKNAARRLRAGGETPGVLYGLEGDPVAFAVNSKSVARILASPSGQNKVITLTGGVSGSAMTSDYQVDPVTGRLLHVDMRRVDANTAVTVDVNVVTTGVPAGVKDEGGIEDMILRQVRLECLPAAVPEKIEIDVTALKVGDSLRARDLVVAGDVKIITKPDAVLVRVVGRKAEEEEEEAEEEAVEGAEAVDAEGDGEKKEE
jgi:large subunit ribosomal protein L25